MKGKKRNRRSSFTEGLEQKFCGLGITEMLIRDCPSDAEKVSKIIEVAPKFFPSKAVESDCDQKCAENSLKLRKEGNVFHTENRYRKALLLYTRSIALAPANSPTFCYAFANRAALLKDMGHYTDSIADNQRALRAGYPENNCYLLYLRQGVCYRQLGQFGKAQKSLNKSMKSLENQSSMNENVKNQMRQNIKAELSLCTNEREEECEDLTGDKSIGVLKFDVPSLGSNVNPEIPTASDCIALKYNETYGRHLVATRDIEPGEVLIVEEPFAAFLDPSHCFTHCSHCFKLCRTLLPCQQCAWAMFCSEACIEESHSYHQLECAMMPGFLKAEERNLLHLTARIVTIAGNENLEKYFDKNRYENTLVKSYEEKRTAGFNHEGKYVSSDLNAVANLCPYEPASCQDLSLNCMLTATLMQRLKFDKLPCGKDLGGFIVKFISSSSQNVTCITEYHKDLDTSSNGIVKMLGLSINPTYALMNHSCNSNTIYHHYGKTLVVKSSKFITKGSQIYTNSNKSYYKYPRENRQKYCFTLLHFFCKCEACIESWPTYSKMPSDPLFPDQKSLGLKVSKSMNNLMKVASGNPTDGWQVTASTLPLFQQHLKLLDQLDKARCHQYIIMQRSVRNFFFLQGNHVDC